MLERFTDRARKVMALANQEAQRLNHEYIGTEHILLGLVKEGSGVGANVLKNLGADLPTIRNEIKKLVGPGHDPTPILKLPQTPRAKRVLEYAIEEARRLDHNYIGTEHLLLGLLREEASVAARVLTGLGVTLDAARQEVSGLLETGVERTPPRPPWQPPPGPGSELIARAMELLEQAKDEAVNEAHYERAAEIRDAAEYLRMMLDKKPR
ncbi:MAG: hypothetical protein HY718_10975 [Planctomycetes bacterium]|nr:hypothetical protein [Planctomycetota bacterium]